MHNWGLKASRKSEQQSRGPEVEVGWMCPRNREEMRGGGAAIKGRFWELRPERSLGPVCGIGLERRRAA